MAKSFPQAENIATIDFETDPFEANKIPQAFACGWSDGKVTETFWRHYGARKEDREKAHKEVIRWAINKIKRFEGIVYAHNGGKFDFTGLIFPLAGKLLHGQEVLYIGNRVVKMGFGAAEIRDSYAILPAPLSAYDKGEIDYRKFYPEVRQRHKAEILQYLRRDVDSLRELVIRFVEQHGRKVCTAASAAMRAIKQSGVKIESLKEYGDSKYRAYYFGGRTQALKPGIHNGRFTVYDIKSAYPFAMLSNHPLSRDFESLHNPKPCDIIGSDLVIVQGDVKGCFPVRRDEKLQYPTERGTFYVTGWEYIAANELGLLGKHRIVFADRAKRTGNFQDYVFRFYREKAEAEANGDAAGRLISKILINSGYGKLAQRPDKWREYLVVNAKFIPDGDEWETEYISEDNSYKVISCPSSSPPTYYNVAAAASITGYVRAMLMRKIATLDPYYCDTDSIIVDSCHKMEIGENLGDWSEETKGDKLLIAGKKLYALRIIREICSDEKTAKKKGYQWYEGRAWKVASKGCRLTPSEMHEICNGGCVEYIAAAPTYSFTGPARFIVRKIRMTA